MKELSVKNIFEVLNNVIENLNISEGEENEDLSKRGMDSLAFVEAVVTLEEEFGIEIPDSKLILSEMNTVNKIYAILNAIPREHIL